MPVSFLQRGTSGCSERLWMVRLDLLSPELKPLGYQTDIRAPMALAAGRSNLGSHSSHCPLVSPENLLMVLGNWTMCIIAGVLRLPIPIKWCCSSAQQVVRHPLWVQDDSGIVRRPSSAIVATIMPDPARSPGKNMAQRSADVCAGFGQGPRTMSYNPADNAVLITSDAEGGSYELYVIPKDHRADPAPVSCSLRCFPRCCITTPSAGTC